MSFSIQPGKVDQVASTTPSQSTQSARERAISMLQSSAPQSNSLPAPAEALQNMPNPSAEPAQTGTNVEGSEQTPQAEAKRPEKALSPQYAALARKEKAIRSQVQQLKAKELEIAAREKAYTEKDSAAAKALELVTRLEKDPLGVLSERGITYDKLAQAALSQPSEQEQMISALRAEVDALKAELKSEVGSTKKIFEEQQTAAYKQAVNQIRQDVNDLVRNNADFETIAATRSVNDVVELIEKTFQRDGILLSVEEAAREVEEYLAEEAFKLTKLKKLQSRLQPKAAPAATPATPAPKQDSKQPQPEMKTLTNAVSTNRKLTARERAVLAFKGELK